MSRVLILTNSSGGLYDFRNEFVEALLQEHEVFISLPDEVKTEELRAEGAEIIQTPIHRRGMNPFEDIRLYLAYRHMMKKLRPDLVVTYTIKPNIYGGMAAASRKIPHIATITGLGGAFDKKGPLLRLIVSLYRMGLKRTACVFFQNQENQEICRSCKIMGRTQRLVMGSGVNLQRHRYEPYPDDGTVRFLFMGRVMRERGILEFVAAAEKLHSDRVYFEILGSCDEDYQEFLDALEKRDVIRRLGFHTEVHPYVARASAVVVASFHEGMSNTLIEGAATGRPVIASRISGCREAFEEGVTGFGFTPGNAGELIAAMERFLALSQEEKAEMGRLGREKMEREFDRKQVTAAYMEVVSQNLNK